MILVFVSSIITTVVSVSAQSGQQQSYVVVAKKIDEKGTVGSALTLSRRNIDDNVKDKFASDDNNSSSNHSKGLLPSCPDGSELIKGKCVCPDGSSPKNNKCSIQPNPKPIKCPDGSSMVDGKCQCPDDSEISNGKCICPADSSSPINGKCPKPSPPGSLTFLSVVKKIINNGIGNKKPSDFTITVTGNDPSPSSFSGSSSGTSVTLRAGNYKVTETKGPSGYTTSYSSGCSDRIDAGQTKDCTITNEANKSPEPKPLVTTIRGFSAPMGLAYDSNNKYVYVTNYGDSSSNSNNEAAGANKVSIIDTSTADKVIDTVSVGKKPLAITYNPSNNHVYVANTFSDTVSVIDTLRNNNIISDIAVGHFPGNTSSGLAYNSNNAKIYVANIASDSVSEIDSSTNAATSIIKQLFNPAGIAYDPINGHVYVTNKEANTVSVIDTLRNNKLIATIPVGISPSAIIFDSDNGHVYVANTGSDNFRDTISVIDTSINKVIATILVGNGPNGITLDSSSGKIYVTNTFSNNISVIDDSKNKVITTISVSTNPYGIVYNSSNHHIYVANHGSNSISVISP